VNDFCLRNNREHAKDRQPKELRRANKMKIIATVATLVLVLGFSLTASAQYSKSATTSKMADKKAAKAERSDSPTLTATLIDAEKKAKEKAATVEVKVTGIELIDPAKVGEKPKTGQGHLHYRVDDGPIIATTTTKLSFHELTPGNHKITVMLAGNDHNPLGPQQTLEVKIPG
jgi:Family of unknown function (DUF6130)